MMTLIRMYHWLKFEKNNSDSMIFFIDKKQIFHFFGGTTHDGRRKEKRNGAKARTKQL